MLITEQNRTVSVYSTLVTWCQSNFIELQPVTNATLNRREKNAWKVVADYQVSGSAHFWGGSTGLSTDTSISIPTHTHTQVISWRKLVNRLPLSHRAACHSLEHKDISIMDFYFFSVHLFFFSNYSMYEKEQDRQLKPHFCPSPLYPTVPCLWWLYLGLQQLKLASQLWAITVRPVGPTVCSLTLALRHTSRPVWRSAKQTGRYRLFTLPKTVSCSIVHGLRLKACTVSRLVLNLETWEKVMDKSVPMVFQQPSELLRNI